MVLISKLRLYVFGVVRIYEYLTDLLQKMMMKNSKLNMQNTSRYRSSQYYNALQIKISDDVKSDILYTKHPTPLGHLIIFINLWYKLATKQIMSMTDESKLQFRCSVINSNYNDDVLVNIIIIRNNSKVIRNFVHKKKSLKFVYYTCSIESISWKLMKNLLLSPLFMNEENWKKS